MRASMDRNRAEIAIVTPSYWRDFERCRLLVESAERFATGHARHCILISRSDVPLFRQLERPGVELVELEAVLPRGFVEFPWNRRYWLTPFSLPVRGWILQQIGKIAFAASLHEDVALFMDSDTFFLRPTDLRRFVRDDGRVRLFRTPGNGSAEQRRWHEAAHRLLDSSQPIRASGYIGNAISWRTDVARAMTRRLRDVHGRPFTTTLARSLSWSEYILYGDFCEFDPAMDALHFADDSAFCHEHWDEVPLSAEGVRTWMREAPAEACTGMISAKSGTPIETYRPLVLEGAAVGRAPSV